MEFNIKQAGPRDSSLIKLPKSPAIMASGISTKLLSESSNKLCDRLKLILLEKQAGNNFDIINEEIVAIVDKLIE